MTLAEANSQIEVSRDDFVAALKKCYGDSTGTIDKDGFEQVVKAFPKIIDKISSVIIGLGKSIDLNEKSNERNDLEATVLNFLDTTFDFYYVMLRDYARVNNESPSLPSKNSFNTLQVFLNSVSDDATKMRYKEKFMKENIPVESLNKTVASPMSESNQKKVSIITGGICIVVVLAILLLRQNLPAQLSTFLHILFAIGCGGIAAALIGTLTVNLQSSKGIIAAGGFAVFVLIFFFNPVAPPDSPFQVSVSLVEAKTTEQVDGTKIKLQMQLDEDLVTGKYFLSNETYVFANVPPKFIGKNVDLRISQSPNWMFSNGKRTTTFVLTPGFSKVDVKKDSSFYVVKGQIVADEANGFMVAVSAYGLSSLTDSLGKFSINIPQSHDNDNVRVDIKKGGFQPYSSELALGRFHSIPIFKMP